MKTKLINKKVHLLTLMAMLFSLAIGNLAFAQEGDPIPEPDAVADATDTAFPSDVEGVVATAGDGMVTLSWDAATDNVGVTGYKIFYGENSVSTDSASYTMGPEDVGNVLTYDVEGLENGKTYYFAITAYDAAGNESEFYSLEVSGTPEVGASSSDTTAPQVASAMATYSNMVKVTFSEGIVLPATTPESAFAIKDDFLGTALDVMSAELDATDTTNKTVLLTTAEQDAASKYILTVGIEVQDMSGNPIVSGTSDTAVFNGSDLLQENLNPAAEETPQGDTTPPALTNVVAISGNSVEVTFSEPVVLLSNAAENFIITDVNDNTKLTNINKVDIQKNGTQALLTTDDLEAKQYNLIVLKIKDLAGNEIPVQNSATTFAGIAAVAEAPAGETPVVVETPQALEDAVYDLMAKKMANLMIQLTWKTHEDKMADVANFVVYMSTDRGATYGPGQNVAKDLMSYDFSNLQADMTYYFKLTTMNAAGEESEGVITYLTLPATGPELLFLLFGSAGAGAFITRKKKKK